MSVLFVNACVRSGSRTNRLARYFLENISEKVETVNLTEENILPLDGARLCERDLLLKECRTDAPLFYHARKFSKADTIVIAAPFWDLSFPSLLKLYLENVSVSGITFRYENGRPVGLCRAEQLVYITTAGGPMFSDFGFSYIKTLCNVLFGIKKTFCFKAENLDIDGADIESLLKAAEEEINHFFAR